MFVLSPSGKDHASFRAGSTAPAKRCIAKVLAHLQTDYAQSVRLAHLAALTEIHPSHLSREFKKQVGCSPRTYVLRLRIERAVVLLTEAHLSIKEIGLSVGFERPEAFSKAFKRVMGCAPRPYREHGDHQDVDNEERDQI